MLLDNPALTHALLSGLTWQDVFIYTLAQHPDMAFWMIWFLFVGGTLALLIQSLAMWTHAMLAWKAKFDQRARERGHQRGDE